MMEKRPANRHAADVLLALAHLGGGGTISDIEKASTVNRFTITYHMKGLVKHAYVKRIERHYSLTDLGRTAVRLIREDRGR